MCVQCGVCIVSFVDCVFSVECGVCIIRFVDCVFSVECGVCIVRFVDCGVQCGVWSVYYKVC